MRGLSLIEILIALAIGSLLILGLVQVFSASRTAYQLSEGMARSQENARFAMEYLQRDIRMAGHYGCVNDQSHMQVPGALTRHFADATPGTNGIAFPISVHGYDANGTAPGGSVTLSTPTPGWTPELPAALLDPLLSPAPSPGSDIIELRFLGNEGVPVGEITNPTTTSTSITIKDPSERWPTLTENGVASPTMFGIADCSYVDVFAASAVTPATGTVIVDQPITRYTPQPAGQTMLYRAESLVYYIAPNATGVPALWRGRSNTAGTYSTEELVEGIENLQLLFGLDSVPDLDAAPPSGFVAQQQPASAVLPDTEVTWRGVGQVQVGLLAASPNRAAATQATAPPRTALGVSFDTPDDGNYRASYEATIALRNRLYGN